MQLSGTQKLVKFFTSTKKFNLMREESQLWGFVCSNCNKRSNIWELGGVRYKAKGKWSTRIRCPHCKTIAMQKIFKSESE